METIKKLRELTGAGMVDCQKALKEANNDLEKAIEILRKKGIAKAAKRTDREANEGIIKVAVNEAGDEGYILEVNSETDFVSRNEKFQTFADEVLTVIKTNKPKSLDELLAMKLGNGTVQEELDNLSGTIGEKMGIKRFEILNGATVGAYSHLGGKMGVLVSLDQAGKNELAVNVAMQIAAANPKYITSEDVSADELAKEKEIYKEQLIKEGKPEAMVDKIVEGKMGKFYSEVCLVEQEYIKDDKQKVKNILAGTKVLHFIRFSL
ncbi:MAG: translation elongation factor Ts [Patescibacteria group bacterium]|jgi:elongation factor Ts|nr:translation elongation factor Ts [bacterium]HQC49514.1 translation elongation factor Ts [bacterium]